MRTFNILKSELDVFIKMYNLIDIELVTELEYDYLTKDILLSYHSKDVLPIASVLSPEEYLGPKGNLLSIRKKVYKTHQFLLHVYESPLNIVRVFVKSDSFFLRDVILTEESEFNTFRKTVGFFRAPSSGKSTASSTMMNHINKNLGGKSYHVHEYATTFIQKYDRTPKAHEQMIISEGQIRREKAAGSRSDVVISDSPSFMSYLYYLFINQERLNKENKLMPIKLYQKVLEDSIRYDRLFFMKLINYRNNGIRFQKTKEEALIIEEHIKNFLLLHNIPFDEYQSIDMAAEKIYNLTRVKL